MKEFLKGIGDVAVRVGLDGVRLGTAQVVGEKIREGVAWAFNKRKSANDEDKKPTKSRAESFSDLLGKKNEE